MRLLPNPWPSDALPPPTASLLSIASNKGLLAAAGPDSVIIASTESVIQAFTANGGAGGDVKAFSPQLTLPIGARVSQVAFSADENHLVISAENGGGLAVYEVQALMQGNTQSAFQMATNGTSLRALIPNPTPEKAEYFAVVTSTGALMMANMKTRQFLSGPSGQVMKDGVSCVSWSTRGKQLVAGLGNSTGYQMTPEGEGKAEIPRPPGLEGDQHGKQLAWHYFALSLIRLVSAISWLENNVFLLAHTPSSSDAGIIPATTYTLATRQPPAAFTFEKLPEVCGPFGLPRTPPFQFMQRLRDFPPNIQDILLVASSASIDIGLFTRAKTPLAKDVAPEKITNVFTTTMMANDSRRAQLPMTEDMSSDTSPIGMALDLSSKIKVSRPLPGEEMDESQGPLPALMVLNNVGILMAWWVVYADSVRQGTTYPGLVAMAGQQTKQAPQVSHPAFAAVSQPSAVTFGQSAFGTPSTNAFGMASTSTSEAPAFGLPASLGSTTGTFGAPSGLGNQQSPWGASINSSQSVVPAFGKPSFGSSTPLGTTIQGSTFGTSGGLGFRQSPWSTTSTATPTGPTSVFGQAGGLGTRAGSTFGSIVPTSTFGSASNEAPSSNAGGGFAAFARAPGFAASAAQSNGPGLFSKPAGPLPAAAEQSNPDGIFGKGSTPSVSFDSAMDIGSSFGVTPTKPSESSGGLFGSGTPFVLGSSWKNENPPKKDIPDTSSLFGSGFAKTLDETTIGSGAPQIAEAEMKSEPSDEGELPDSPTSEAAHETTTPADTPAPAKFFSAPPLTGGLFSTQSQSTTTPAAVQSSIPAPSTFEKPTPSPVAPKVKSPTIKPEPDDAPTGVDKALPEAPLPVDSRTKSSYTPGGSSVSSTVASKSSQENTPSSTNLHNERVEEQAHHPPADHAAAPLDLTKTKTDPILPETPSNDALPSQRANIQAAAADPSNNTIREEPALPMDDEDGGLDDEGSGVDVAQEISPITDPDQGLNITPESSFGGKNDKSPVGGLFQNINKSQPSKSLFGEIGKTSAPFFPPPKMQQSPRSPSPIRASLDANILRPDSARSVSAPGLPSRASNTRKVSNMPLHSKVVPMTISSAQPPKDQENRLALARQQEEESLSDEEDERVRDELATEILGTLDLAPFLAHQDYVGDSVKPGVPGQIEMVYRDINSMIDTLGLNSRALQSFVKGHEELYKEAGRARADLEDSESWCLVEISDLASVEQSLQNDLDEGRLQGVDEKLEECSQLLKDLKKLDTKFKEAQRILNTKNDPGQVEALQRRPLSDDQAMLRKDLRRAFTTFQTLLGRAEDSVSLLRAKLAAHGAGKNNIGKGSRIPTVEAVERTIRKMTEMVQNKSADIDVLESQMRKLNVVGSVPSSREASPFVTPPTSIRKAKSLLRTPGTGRSVNSHAAFYTPMSSRSVFGNSLASSMIGSSPSPRKNMDQLDAEVVKRFAVKAKRRKEVNAILKEALVRDGIRIRSLDDL